MGVNFYNTALIESISSLVNPELFILENLALFAAY